MLQNAPTLAIRGLDTAENGPSKVRQVTNKIRHNIGFHNLGRDVEDGVMKSTVPTLLVGKRDADVKTGRSEQDRVNVHPTEDSQTATRG